MAAVQVPLSFFGADGPVSSQILASVGEGLTEEVNSVGSPVWV